MQHFAKPARMLIVSALTASLIACGGGSSSSSDDDDDDAQALRSINGTYVSDCFRTSAAASTQITYEADDGDLTITTTTYMDGACTVNPMAVVTTATYELGDVVGLDGSVDNITSATEIDLTSTSAPTTGEISYSIVARKGDLAYIGEDSGDNDGSTAAKRHDQLDEDFALTRQ